MFGLAFKKKIVTAPASAGTAAAETRTREAEASAATLARIVRVSDEIAAEAAATVDASAFRDLAEAHADARRAALVAEEIARRTAREARVAEMREERLDDDAWRLRLERALEAAARGEKEYLLLRFPSELCADGGRMINAPDPEWPTSLRGPAADIHARWHDELRSRGFGLTARILEFPGGFPGDAGLFLTW